MEGGISSGVGDVVGGVDWFCCSAFAFGTAWFRRHSVVFYLEIELFVVLFGCCVALS